MKSSYKKEITEEYFFQQRLERSLIREEERADSNLMKISVVIAEYIKDIKEQLNSEQLDVLIRKIIKLKLVTKDNLTDTQLYSSTEELVLNCL